MALVSLEQHSHVKYVEFGDKMCLTNEKMPQKRAQNWYGMPNGD